MLKLMDFKSKLMSVFMPIDGGPASACGLACARQTLLAAPVIAAARVPAGYIN